MSPHPSPLQTGSVFTVRVKAGPALVMCTSSRDESLLWVGAIKELLVAVPVSLEKGRLLEELLSDGAARRNLRKKFNRRERKAREALTAARLKTARGGGPLTEGAAIGILQRAMRGHAARNMVRGWVRVKDPESGEVYYYNINTGKSEWKAPWQGAKVPELSVVAAPGGGGGGGGGGGAPPAPAPPAAAPSAPAPPAAAPPTSPAPAEAPAPVPPPAPPATTAST